MKRSICLGLLAGLALLLCGCMFSGSSEELYQLPRLPLQYTGLEEQLDNIAAGGAESTAPVYGSNVQSVQLVDLDGDGSEEAVAFFHNTAETKPLKVYIFAMEDGTYQQKAMLEGSGSSIYSIRYVDMNGDGYCEVAIGWRSGADVLSLSVYSLKNFKPQLLLTSSYARASVTDLDGDGQQELVVVRSSAEEETTVADYYDWSAEGNLQLFSSTRLSMTVAELSRLTEGRLGNGDTALFVSGVEDASRLVVDILTVRGTEMKNLTARAATGFTGEIFTFYNVFPRDINGDGLTEVPQARENYRRSEDGAVNVFWLIDWLQYDENGASSSVLTTYYDAGNGWYLEIPAAWQDSLSVQTSDLLSGEYAVLFTVSDKSHRSAEVLTIYVLTGESREKRATGNGRILLNRLAEKVYACALPKSTGNGVYLLDEGRLKQAFHLITTEWVTGEY